MDLSEIGININVTLLIAMVGIIEYIKKKDKENKLKNLYGLFYIGLCLIVGAFLAVKDGLFESVIVGISQSFINLIIYFGIGTLFYQLIVSTVKKYTEKKLEGKNE